MVVEVVDLVDVIFVKSKSRRNHRYLMIEDNVGLVDDEDECSG